MSNLLLVFSGKRVSQENPKTGELLFSTMLIYQQARLKSHRKQAHGHSQIPLDGLGGIRDDGRGGYWAMGDSWGLGIIPGILVNILDWVLYQNFDMTCCASYSDRNLIQVSSCDSKSKFGFRTEI